MNGQLWKISLFGMAIVLSLMAAGCAQQNAVEPQVFGGADNPTSESRIDYLASDLSELGGVRQEGAQYAPFCSDIIAQVSGTGGAGLRLRTAPTVNSGTIAIYKDGTVVNLENLKSTRRDNYDWYHVTVVSVQRDGFMAGQYLRITQTAAPKPPPVVGKPISNPPVAAFKKGDLVEVFGTNGIGLNVRPWPTKTPIDCMPDGTRGKVLANDTIWQSPYTFYFIEFNAGGRSVTGWSAGDWLRKYVAPLPPPPPPPANPVAPKISRPADRTTLTFTDIIELAGTARANATIYIYKESILEMPSPYYKPVLIKKLTSDNKGNWVTWIQMDPKDSHTYLTAREAVGEKLSDPSNSVEILWELSKGNLNPVDLFVSLIKLVLADSMQQCFEAETGLVDRTIACGDMTLTIGSLGAAGFAKGIVKLVVKSISKAYEKEIAVSLKFLSKMLGIEKVSKMGATAIKALKIADLAQFVADLNIAGKVRMPLDAAKHVLRRHGPNGTSKYIFSGWNEGEILANMKTAAELTVDDARWMTPNDLMKWVNTVFADGSLGGEYGISLGTMKQFNIVQAAKTFTTIDGVSTSTILGKTASGELRVFGFFPAGNSLMYAPKLR